MFIKEKFCLRSWLSEFGLVSEESKDALERLFHLTTIIPIGQTWSDIFPTSDNEEELLRNLLTMVEKTQEKLVMRSRGQERSMISEPEYVKNNKQEIIDNVRLMGAIDGADPRNYSPDAICIFGSTRASIQRKIKYTSVLMKKKISTRYMILLTGERYLKENTDGSRLELESLAKKIGLENGLQLTETDLFKEIYQNSDLPSYGIPLHVIDTPRRNLPRPNSETSLVKMTEWLKDKKDIKSILFISNQPYIRYQNDITNLVFKHAGCECKFEIVGPGIEDYDDVNRIIGGVGSSIWEILPNILPKLELSHVSEDIKIRLEKIYYSRSLIYQHFPEVFKI